MKKMSVLFPLAVLCCISLVLGGCAKKAVVKEESAVKEAPVKAEPKPAKPEKSAVKEAPPVEKKEKATKEAAAAPSQTVVYELVNINFDFDKYNLTDDARGILKKHADWLNKNNKVAIVVEGHCDERGTAEYNLALGERRALEAKKYLVGLGVAESRMKTVSYGKAKPLDPGHNETAWTKNRRDQFVPAGNK